MKRTGRGATERTFTVRVPATTANLGPGYDVLGAALTLYNDFEVTVAAPRGARPELEFLIDGEGAGELPADGRNVVWRALKATVETLSPGAWQDRFGAAGFRLRAVNRVPLASGLGSSASAALAGILAAYRLLRRKVSVDEVLDLGVRYEGHPDNIVPALAGGLCVSYSEGGRPRFVRLDPPALKAVVVTPSFGLSTARARRALPKRYPAADAVFNVSRTALLMAALQTRRYELLGTAMDDRLHQPYREPLIPGRAGVFAAARAAGAFGVAVSGAGPSLAAFASSGRARAVARAMADAWRDAGVDSRSRVLDFAADGAAVI